MSSRVQAVCAAALALLTPAARTGYTGQVITGHQRWSGADLKGKARLYAPQYDRQRRVAREALRQAGGAVIVVDHGRMVTACVACTDDYGDSIYQTVEGDLRRARRSLAILYPAL